MKRLVILFGCYFFIICASWVWAKETCFWQKAPGGLQAKVCLARGKPQEISYYRPQAKHPIRREYFSHGKLRRIVLDEDANGKPEKISYLSPRGILTRESVDEDGDGYLEKQIFYNAKGQVLRIEIDQNRDGKPEKIIYLRHGRVQKVVKYLPQKREICLFSPETGLLKRVEIFPKGKKVPAEIQIYAQGLLHTLKKDLDGDGLFEEVWSYQNGHPVKLLEDLDHDGAYERTIYYDAKGRPVKILLDRNHNGRAEITTLLKAGKVEKVLFDPDEDGFPEKVRIKGPDGEEVLYYRHKRLWRRELYRGQKLVAYQEDQDGDGFLETRASYQKGHLAQVEILTPKGKVREIRFYNGQGQLTKILRYTKTGLWTWIYQNGRAIRLEEDRNLDGHPEKTVIYQKSGRQIVIRDTNSDGAPERWEVFSGQKLVKVKRDLDGDGRPDLTEEVSP